MAKQPMPPGRRTLGISRMAWAAPAWPPKCSIELKEYTTSKVELGKGRARPSEGRAASRSRR